MALNFGFGDDEQGPVVLGATGLEHRARLTRGVANVQELALEEDPAGSYSGSVALSPMPDNSTDDDDFLNFEVRAVTAQTSEAFDDAATYDPETGAGPVLGPGFYGYIVNGEWSNSFALSEQSNGPGIATGFEGRYTTEGKCDHFLGSLNLTVYNDTDDDGARDDGSTEQAIVSSEANVDLETDGPYTFTANLNGTIAAANFERWSRYLASTEMVNKRLGGQSGDSADDDRQTVYRFRKEAMDQMKRFKAGELVLPGAIPLNTATGQGGVIAEAPSVANYDGSAVTASQLTCARNVRRCGGVPFVC